MTKIYSILTILKMVGFFFLFLIGVTIINPLFKAFIDFWKDGPTKIAITLGYYMVLIFVLIYLPLALATKQQQEQDNQGDNT